MASSVSITDLDLKGETVTITKSDSLPASLAGWTSTDEGAKYAFTFAGATVPAAGSVTKDRYVADAKKPQVIWEMNESLR